jgi:DUF917 family protein
VSAVGAPAAKNRYLKPIHFVTALERLIDNTSQPLSGIISSEMGGRASVNGIVQSAVLNLPVVDAPANGRAHPLGVMGGLGLHKRESYLSVQAACGGESKQGRSIELVVFGEVERCGALVREASVQAGGVVAVARNPVAVSWLESHAAGGALARAQALGKKYMSALEGCRDAAKLLAEELGGEVIARGSVSKLEMQTKAGLDIGFMVLDTGHKFTIWNEYITAELGSNYLYSFPDLITSIDALSNMPVNTCQLQQGMELCLIGVHHSNLILGATMSDRHLLEKIEDALNIKLP